MLKDLARLPDPFAAGDRPGGVPVRATDRLPLLTSKLVPAPLPGVVLARPRLLRQLDTAVGDPVTVLLAPAGWGKTTLLSSWVRDRHPRFSMAWLSLESDDRGTRLWSYLRKALLIGEGWGDQDLPAPDEEPEHFLTHLADALARRPQPLVLVLDDLHRAEDPALFDGLEFLLRHAEGRLRLVLSSRAAAAPLHRWRLSGELAEFGPAELSFTAAETGELLTRHGCTLPADHVAKLHARAEGWPAALRLAALSLRNHPDPARLVDEFGGEHPDVAGYLADEVLGGLSVDVREALARASIAPRFTGALIGALTGRIDGDELLEQATQSGFVLPLDGRPAAYRCHWMLTDLLRANLRRRSPEEIRELHRRAATWYAAHGEPAHAVHHALVAGEWRQAVEVVVGHWRDLATDGEAEALTVPDPPPSEAVRAEPELALAGAAERMGARDLKGAEDYLRLAARHQHLLDGARRHRLEQITAAFRLASAQQVADWPKVQTAARQLLELSPPQAAAGGGPTDPGARALARTGIGSATLALGDLMTAETELEGALGDAEQAGLSRLVVASAGQLALVRALRGELRAAGRAADRALAAPGETRLSARAPAYLALALVAIHRDQPDDAEANLALGAEAAMEPTLAALRELILALVRQDRGDLVGGHRALSIGRRLAAGAPSPWLAHWFAAVDAGFALARGDKGRARDMLTPLLDQPDAQLAVALARVHLYAGDPHAAARTLPDWDGAQADLPLPVRLDAGLQDALATRMMGDHRRSARLLERVLQLAEPDGYRRVFTRAQPPVRDLLTAHLDTGTAHWSLVNELIDACGDPEPVRPSPTGPAAPGEPLTERELTVLRYLQSILSNGEIASELSLSVNTVKTHVRNIYRKLDATRRRDAVQRARELRLL